MADAEVWVLVRADSMKAHLGWSERDALCGVKRPRKGWGVVADGLSDRRLAVVTPCERCERKHIPGGIDRY